MKRIFLVFLVSLFVSFVYAQTKTEVKPADLKKEITDNVAKDYAGYKIDKAFKEDSKGTITYRVMISKERSRLTIIYDKDGKFMKKIEPPVKTEVKVADLKKEITDNVAKDYPGFNITKAVKVEENDVVTYHIFIKKDNEAYSLLYDKDGKFIKKSEQGKGGNGGAKKDHTPK